MNESAFPVTITPEAWKQIQRLLERKGAPGQALRIGVKGGGCTGLEYVIRLDEKPLDIDIEIENEGARVVCDAKSSEFLKGSSLVYTGNLIGGGFKFENPNADRSCGCGTSFSMKRQGTS